MQKPPRSKKVGDTNEGIPSSFITHLEWAQYEKRMTKGKELEVSEDQRQSKFSCTNPTRTDNSIIVYSTRKWVL